MRLINTIDGTMVEVTSQKAVKYAILSHRWEGSEPSFQDYQRDPSAVLATAKISGLLRTARSGANYGPYDYVWVDTVCIDKTSSAELQESINSMYEWYESAGVCYVYMSDVTTKTEDPRMAGSQFRRSQWFRRGWTLQELLAPEKVLFFNREWDLIGEKKFMLLSGRQNKATPLVDVIAEVTNIPEHALLMSWSVVWDYSVAQRLSWASLRETSRVEDQAYSLLGLLQVNMPMLYGEGARAFARLQREIMQLNGDHSLLAYNYAWWPAFREGSLERGNLDLCPADYKGCGAVSAWTLTLSSEQSHGIQHHTITNMGLLIELNVLRLPELSSLLIARLDCKVDASRCVALPLCLLGPQEPHQQTQQQHNSPVVVYRIPVVPLVDLPKDAFASAVPFHMYIRDALTLRDRLDVIYNPAEVLSLDITLPPFFHISELYPLPTSCTKVPEVHRPSNRYIFSLRNIFMSESIYLRMSTKERPHDDVLVRLQLEFAPNNQLKALRWRLSRMPAESRTLLELLALGKYPKTGPGCPGHVVNVSEAKNDGSWSYTLRHPDHCEISTKDQGDFSVNLGLSFVWTGILPGYFRVELEMRPVV